MDDIVTSSLIKKTAFEREAIHRFDKSSRQLTRNTNETGLRGEHAFGSLTGYYPDISRKRHGDGGIDFVIPFLATVDVKTRREYRGGLQETYMLVEEHKVAADIYVLSILSDDEANCECIGWITRRDVLKYPVKDLGTGVKNHQIPALDLLSMGSLINRLPKWEAR